MTRVSEVDVTTYIIQRNWNYTQRVLFFGPSDVIPHNKKKFEGETLGTFPRRNLIDIVKPPFWASDLETAEVAVLFEVFLDLLQHFVTKLLVHVLTIR